MSDRVQHEANSEAIANGSPAVDDCNGPRKVAVQRDEAEITPSEAAFSIAMSPAGPHDPATEDTLALAHAKTPSSQRSRGGQTSPGRWDPFRLPVIDKNSYNVGGEVAQGGNGRILRARDGRLDRPVALKELLASGSVAEERFVCEALLTARLQHPCIVPVYEAGRWPSGEPFYAMKLVSGRSLAEVISQAPTLDARLALLPHVLAVAEAMAYAHSERIIHRDLKPANILIGDFGETVVIDWGLAKDLTGKASVEPQSKPGDAAPNPDAPGAEGLTMAGAIMGTPAYMPPEQAEGEMVDERADVYAIGAILYHVLAGVPPYDGSNSLSVLEQVLAGAPMALSARQPGVPEDLRDIVHKAMARNPRDRYPTARELSDDLRRFQTGQIVAAHRYTKRELVRRFVQRHRAALAATAVALLVILGIGGVSLRRIIEARDDAAVRQREAEAAQRHAEAAQQQAIERADDLTLVQARNSLDEDPNRALAWLKTLSPSFHNWSAARLIAADAESRGISTVLRGHTKGVNFLTFSPDGSTIATSSDDTTVRLWNIKTGENRILSGHTDEAYAVAFSHDGRTLATGSLDRTIRLWNLATGDSRILSGHSSGVMHVLFTSDDRRLLSVSTDRTVRVWDIESGTGRVMADAGEKGQKLMPTLSADASCATVVTPEKTLRVVDLATGKRHETRIQLPDVVKRHYTWKDGRTVVGFGEDNTIWLWDTKTGQERKFTGHTGPVQAVALAEDVRLLASAAADRTVRVWDTNTGKSRVFEGHAGGVRSLVFSHDGKRLASGSHDHTIRLWDLDTGAHKVLLGFEDSVSEVAFSPDDQTLAGASWDNSVRLWKLQSTTHRILTGHAGEILTEDFSPDGKLLATAGKDGTVRIWPLAGGEPHVLNGFEAQVRDVKFSPDGRHLAAIDTTGDIRLWNSSENTKRILSGHKGEIHAIAFSPDGQRLASAGEDHTMRLWDLGSGAAQVLLGHEAPVLHVAFAPTGRDVASGDRAGVVYLWDTQSAKGRIFRGHTEYITSLRFSEDNQWLASGSFDHTVRLWDLNPAGANRQIQIGGFGGHNVFFSSNGEMLIPITGENAVRLFSMTGQIVRVLRGHEGPVFRAALSPNGRMLATGSEDRTVRLWDLETGENRVLRGHTQRVTAVRFSPDGKLVASVSLDKTVRLWSDDLPTGAGELRAWLNTATGDTIDMEHNPPLPVR